MEYVNTHILMDILWIEVFEVLITHTIWYFYWNLCLNIVPLLILLKGLNSIFTLNIFCYKQYHISVIYWYSFVSEFLLLLDPCVHISFNSCSILHIWLPWFSTFEYFTRKLLDIFLSFCEHRDTESYRKNIFDQKNFT